MNSAVAIQSDIRGVTAGTAAHPTVVRRTRSSDIEQHTRQLQDWNLRYDQLDAGPFAGRFTDIRWPGMQLFVESTSRRVRQRGELMADSLGVGVMLRGAGPLSVNAVRCDASSLVACNATELDMCTPPDCILAGVVVDTTEMLQAAQAFGGGDSPFGRGSLLAMTPPPAVLERWRRLLRDAVQAAIDPAAGLPDSRSWQRLHDDLQLSLIDAMMAAVGEERVHGPDRRKRIVDQACDLMLSDAAEPPSLLEVCRHVGASPRKLGYCFQEMLGVSPGRYVKMVRLNAVRRDLCRAEDPRMTVYDVAAHWGFWHFGHFSSDYKRLFAELPSETLSRARGLAPARTAPSAADRAVMPPLQSVA